MIDDVAGLNGDGERKADGGAVGLEGRVAPVAMILGFKRVAGESNRGRDSRHHFMSERAHVEEWLIGGDLQRKCGLGGLPGDVLDEAWPACDSVDRVKDA